MGMDCRLVNLKTGAYFETFNGVSEKKLDREFNEAVEKRNKALNDHVRGKWQRVVEEKYAVLHGRGDMYRDAYNPFSTTNWLAWNVNWKARGDWGLSLLVDKASEYEDQVIVDMEYLKYARNVVSNWYRLAMELSGKHTWLGYPSEMLLAKVAKDEDYVGGLRVWVDSKAKDFGYEMDEDVTVLKYMKVLDEEDTQLYITDTHRLKKFLDEAVKRGAGIYVSY